MQSSRFSHHAFLYALYTAHLDASAQLSIFWRDTDPQNFVIRRGSAFLGSLTRPRNFYCADEADFVVALARGIHELGAMGIGFREHGIELRGGFTSQTDTQRPVRWNLGQDDTAQE